MLDGVMHILLIKPSANEQAHPADEAALRKGRKTRTWIRNPD
jgi:hypothetical protein